MLKAPDNPPARQRAKLPPLSATTVASILVLLDSLAILVCGYITYDTVVVYSPSQDLYMVAVLFVWLVTIAMMNYGSLYRFEVAASPLSHLHGIIVAVGTAYLFLLAAAYSMKVSATFSRTWFIVFAIACIASIGALRMLGCRHRAVAGLRQCAAVRRHRRNGRAEPAVPDLAEPAERPSGAPRGCLCRCL